MTLNSNLLALYTLHENSLIATESTEEHGKINALTGNIFVFFRGFRGHNIFSFLASLRLCESNFKDTTT